MLQEGEGRGGKDEIGASADKGHQEVLRRRAEKRKASSCWAITPKTRRDDDPDPSHSPSSLQITPQSFRPCTLQPVGSGSPEGRRWLKYGVLKSRGAIGGRDLNRPDWRQLVGKGEVDGDARRKAFRYGERRETKSGVVRVSDGRS